MGVRRCVWRSKQTIGRYFYTPYRHARNVSQAVTHFVRAVFTLRWNETECSRCTPTNRHTVSTLCHKSWVIIIVASYSRATQTSNFDKDFVGHVDHLGRRFRTCIDRPAIGSQLHVITGEFTGIIVRIGHWTEFIVSVLIYSRKMATAT